MRHKRITDNQIIEIIKANGGQATAYHIQEATGYTKQNVSLRLNALAKNGRLKTLKIGQVLVLWSI